MKIAIIGAGAWGTALATLCAHNGHEVVLWAYEQSVADDINNARENRAYLPGFTLPGNIRATYAMAEALQDAAWIFEAIPVAHMRKVLQEAKNYCTVEQPWVIASKGIEQGSLFLPAQIIDDTFGYAPEKVILAGPSFACDLAAKDITGVTLAAENRCKAVELQELLANIYFRPYVSEDMVGVQLGGALKNVLTIAVGMLEGAGFADNTKALLLTNGLREAIELGYALGAYKDSFYGLSGVGDLMLSAYGKSSKNLALGRRLGHGATLEQLARELPALPEGINTAKALKEIICREELSLPLFSGICQVLFEDKSVYDMLAFLMSRPLSPHRCCS